MHAHDRLAAGSEKDMRHQLQHLIGAIAENKLVAPHLQPGRNFAGEIPATPVRIKIHLAQSRGSGFDRLG